MVIDGNFPTVVSPNPENPEGFYLAVDLAKKDGADFILGSDPDADRVGIMVRNRRRASSCSSPATRPACCCWTTSSAPRSRAGKLPENACGPEDHRHHRDGPEGGRGQRRPRCYDTFTGFKFMAEKKDAAGEPAGEGKVIFSYEESYGYMLGDYVRDKDAVTASVLLTEMAAWYAAQGMTLFDALQALYEKYGYYGEKTHNLVMPGLDGLEKMADADGRTCGSSPRRRSPAWRWCAARTTPTAASSTAATGAKSAMELSGSNVLRYELADGTTILVRPSGTEPKIKVYVLTIGETPAARDENLRKYGEWVKTLQR